MCVYMYMCVRDTYNLLHKYLSQAYRFLQRPRSQQYPTPGHHKIQHKTT